MVLGVLLDKRSGRVFEPVTAAPDAECELPKACEAEGSCNIPPILLELSLAAPEAD